MSRDVKGWLLGWGLTEAEGSGGSVPFILFFFGCKQTPPHPWLNLGFHIIINKGHVSVLVKLEYFRALQ